MTVTPTNSSKGKEDISLWQRAEVMRPLGALVLSIGAALAVGAAVTIALPFTGISIAASMATLLAITIPIAVGSIIVGILGIYLLSKSYSAKPEPKVEPKKPQSAPPPPHSPPPPAKDQSESELETTSSSSGSDSEGEFQIVDPAKVPLLPSEDESSDEEGSVESEFEISSLGNYDLLETIKKHVGIPELKLSTALTAPPKQRQYTIQRDSFVFKIKSIVQGLSKGEVEIRSAASQEINKFQGELTYPAQFSAILAFAREQLGAFNTQLRAEKEKDSTLNVELIDIEKFINDLVPLLDSFLKKYAKDVQENISLRVKSLINAGVSLKGAIIAIRSIQQSLQTKYNQVNQLYKRSLKESERLAEDLSKIELLLKQLSLIHDTKGTIDDKIERIEEFSQSLPLAKDAFWTRYSTVLACLIAHFSTLFNGGYFANYRFCAGALIEDDGFDHSSDTEKKERLMTAVREISSRLNIEPPKISAENDTSADATLAKNAQVKADEAYARELFLTDD